MRKKIRAAWNRVRSRIISLLISFAVVSVCVGALFEHYRSHDPDDLITTMENNLLDLRFRLRGEREPSGRVGILAIDEPSVQKFGQWPFARTVYKRVFENLKKAGAQWIGSDVVWAEAERPLLENVSDEIQALSKWAESEKPKANVEDELKTLRTAMKASIGDRSLAQGIQNYEKFVMGYVTLDARQEVASLDRPPFQGIDSILSSEIFARVLPGERSLDDYPQLKTQGIISNTSYLSSHANHFAFFNNRADNDAIVRWVTLVKNLDGHLMPSLSLKMASLMTGRQIVVFFDQLGVSEVTLMNPEDDTDLIKIPVKHNGTGRLLLDHLGPGKTIPHFSFADAYDGAFSESERKALEGMSLLMGPTAIGINDQRANPFDSRIMGVENHAAAIDNMVNGTFMRRSEDIYLTELSIVIGIGLLFTPIMVFGRAVFSGISAASFLVGYYFFDNYFWFGQGEWVYMGMPFIEIISLYVGTTLYKYMSEEKEKRKVKGAFSHYLSPEVIDQVLEDPESLRLGGEKKELTVFFSDVRSFTTISESLTPEKLCELMNAYFTPMTGIILRSKGVLDKYIGDAIMAFWGAPLPTPDHADRGAVASVDMLMELDRLREDLVNRGFPTIDIGIGLNTGMMSVGNMGSDERFTYTVMGDAVNLAARLEGLTKEYGAKILISEMTRNALTREDLKARDLDNIRVKGKKEPVKIFELIRPDVLKNSDDLDALIGEFERGREAYLAQNWDEAERRFTECLRIRPGDGPSELFLGRIEERRQEPPIENWDGVYTFSHK